MDDEPIQEYEEEFYENNYGADLEPEEEEEEEEGETITDKKVENVEEEEELEENIITEEIVVNKNINVIPIKKSTPFMTKFEFARLVAVRAKQIEDNCPPHPDVPEELINSLDIAEYELNHSKIPFPFFILRPIGIPHKKMFEKWQTRELILPKDKIIYGL